MSRITLRHVGSGAVTEVELLPEAGGAIGRYSTLTDRQTYHWLLPGDAQTPSAFPMVPFCSRVRDAKFRFGQRTIRLVANFPPEPHAIHGHGWQSAWAVVESRVDMAVLQYQHLADNWPWDYLARQEVELRDSGHLVVSLSVRNQSASTMPAGLGLHPYFPRTPMARLQAAVGEVWETDEQLMPIRRVPLPNYMDLPSGVTVGEPPLDNVFGAWDRQFSIRWPELQAGLRVRASQEFAHLVVYTPAARGYFCAEPATNVTDGFNMLWRGDAGHGVALLEPGAVLRGSMEFAPSRG